MKKRVAGVFSLILGVVLFGLLANAETVSFEDGCISFTYDDSWDGEIYVQEMQAISMKSYIYDAKMMENGPEGAVSVRIKYQDAEDLFTMFSEGEEDSIEAIDGIHFRVINENDPEDIHEVGEILYYQSDFIIYKRIRYSEDHPDLKNLQSMYESIKLADGFTKYDFEPLTDESGVGYSYEEVFRNVQYSEQIGRYAAELINIIDDYLSFAIDGDAALEKASAVIERVETYVNSSDYHFDSKLYADCSDLAFANGWKDDYELEQTIELLKQYIVE